VANVIRFDRSVLKTNQVGIIALNLLAFVFQQPWLVAFVAAVMLAGAADPRLALFQQFYVRVLKPAGLVKPRVVLDDPAPHRFAQALGGAFLVAATLALAVGAALAGWVLVGLVVALAFVNFAFDFCVGCQLFFLLARAGVIRRA
jgi:hypothetical protein